YGRARAFPQGSQTVEAIRIGSVSRRQNHFVIGKQLRIGGTDATFLGAGNWMTRDHSWGKFTEDGLYIGHKTVLGAANVRQHGAVPQDGPNLFQNGAGCPYRHRQHYQITAFDRRNQAWRSFINDPERNTQVEIVTSLVKTHHRFRQLILANGAGQRATDEA